MVKTINELISSAEFPSIITILGEEDFLVEKSIKELTSFLLSKKNTQYDIDIFDGDDSELNKIIEVCLSYPMMTQNRIVVVKRFEKLIPTRPSQSFREHSMLASYLKNPASHTTLIIGAKFDTLSGITKEYASNKSKALKKIEAAKFPYNILLTKFNWMEFPKVRDYELPKWLKSIFTSYKINISDEAIAFIISQAINDLRYINNEIDKILLYNQGKKSLELKDIVEITGGSKEYNIFELQKSVGLRQITKSINILQNMLENARQEILITTMLARYFIVLWKVKDINTANKNNYVLASEMGVNPFAVTEYMNAASKYNNREIEDALLLIKNADLKLKSTSIDSITLLQNTLTEIMKSK